MSHQTQMVMTCADAKKALEKLQKENNVAQEEVQKLHDVRVFYQRQKEHLLQRHDQMKAFIACRQQQVNHAKEITPDEVKKRFDQLYPIVEDIYTKELLLKDLKEELSNVQTQRERKEIQQVLQATDLHVESQDTSRIDNTRPLALWNQYMTAFVEENTRITKERNLKSSCIFKNAVFYHVRFKNATQSPSSTLEELSFSTRHRGICVFICIQATRSADGGISYILTSDLPLNDTQLKSIEYLEDKRNPVDFITEVVWKDIEDHLHYLM